MGTEVFKKKKRPHPYQLPYVRQHTQRSALGRGARARLPEDPEPGTAGQEGRPIYAQDPAPGPPTYRVSASDSSRLNSPAVWRRTDYADPRALFPSGRRACCAPPRLYIAALGPLYTLFPSFLCLKCKYTLFFVVGSSPTAL